MINVLLNLSIFFGYAIMAVFAQNAVFSRGLGVSRLVKMVTDSSVDGLIFCGLLTLIQVVSAPMAYGINKMLQEPEYWFRDYIRPLSLVVCACVAFLLILVVLLIFKPTNYKDITAVLPMATFNTAVIGPLLLIDTLNFTFAQTMGFAMGSGIGYGLAVLIVGEGQRKMSNRNVPAPFRGLPINLLYIGILAIAIYGLVGHRIAI